MSGNKDMASDAELLDLFGMTQEELDRILEGRTSPGKDSAKQILEGRTSPGKDSAKQISEGRTSPGKDVAKPGGVNVGIRDTARDGEAVAGPSTMSPNVGNPAGPLYRPWVGAANRSFAGPSKTVLIGPIRASGSAQNVKGLTPERGPKKDLRTVRRRRMGVVGAPVPRPEEGSAEAPKDAGMEEPEIDARNEAAAFRQLAESPDRVRFLTRALRLVSTV